MSVLQALLIVIVAWVVWKARNFTKVSPLDNVSGPRADSFIYGECDIPRYSGRHAHPLHRKLWDTYGAVVKLESFFRAPALYVYDTMALHNIVVKEPHIYEETPLFYKLNQLVFGDGLLSSSGERHKQQRKVLNPVFHTSHMRSLLHVARQLRSGLVNEVKSGQREIDIHNWMTRVSLEFIGQGGLGHSFDPLNGEWKNPIVEKIKSIPPTFGPLFLILRFLPFVSGLGSPAFRRRVLELTPWKRLHRCIEITDNLEAMSKSILEQKKAQLAQGDAVLEHQIGEGKDIISVLLQANLRASNEYQMSDKELIGHITSLIFTALETTSSALTHTLQSLSEHQEVQDKLRQEIMTARGGREEIPYDELMSLPYLEAVCRETLRLYSPATSMVRRTTKDTIMPLSTPIRGKDGTMISKLLVPKSTTVIIGILACNTNPAIWGQDAREWKPERFLKPLPDSVAEARVPGIYSNLMTFLGGGRACIGFKFSQLEMIVISLLIEKFKFTPSGQEVYWNWSSLQYPTASKEATEPSMPLRIELVR
ncbi:cytochrome P450 [Cristinia sonorae]|uniref:Cytochrome P450 n=1 Tax=Cristinia sonorae TaxID=1940300 RepID=A0A8K0UVF9_9AGAR|nr:cytochrome P450 [Cristinia sonorae]